MSKNIKSKLIIFACVLVLTVSWGLLYLHNGDPVPENTLAKTCPNATDIPCVERAVTNISIEKGLAAGFTALRRRYQDEPTFRPLCFNVSLAVGEALGKQVTDYRTFSYTPESVSCNFGFYQGYATSLLITTGDIKKARSFCEYVGIELGPSVPGVEGECFRGIGRGLPFLKKEYWGDAKRMAAFATDTCADISPSKDTYDLCVHSTFNVLGRASIANLYGLSVDKTDPLWLCSEEPASLQYYCYDNFKWTAVSIVEGAGDLSSQFDAIKKMYGNTSVVTVEQTVESLGYAEAVKSVAKDGVDESFIQSCATLPSPFVSDCIWGFAFGLAKNGMPGTQHSQVIQFCAKAIEDIPSLEKTVCPSQAIKYLHSFYSPEQFKKACADFDRILGVSCSSVGF